MIEEKIKLRITQYIARVLYNDCFAYDFIKSNDTPNINKFVNKLIPNLVALRKKRRVVIHDTLTETLMFSTDTKMQERLRLYLDTIFDKIYFADELWDALSEQVWIRPIKENLTVFDEIIESEIEICQTDMSSYLRSLLNEYAKLPQHQREMLLFEQEMKLIRESIESDRVVNLIYKNQKYSIVFINYYSEFLYDQNNYIIGYDTKSEKLKALNLYKIQNAYLLSKKKHLNDNIYQTYYTVAENYEFTKNDTFNIIKDNKHEKD